jgi:hypothetical protein
MSYIHVHTYVMYGTAAACTTNKNVCTRRGTYNIYFMSHTGTVSGIHTHVCHVHDVHIHIHVLIHVHI